jgi:hypothetical protein
MDNKTTSTHEGEVTAPSSRSTMVSTESTLQQEPISERMRAPRRKDRDYSVHLEQHGSNTKVIRDIIIGFADGLTVPFALTAGLSSYVLLFFGVTTYASPLTISRLGSAKLVIIGGLAELFSGAISMGLGAYLAAVTDRDHYLAEEKREYEEVVSKPNDEKEEIYIIMDQYGVNRENSRPLVEQLSSNVSLWVQV